MNWKTTFFAAFCMIGAALLIGLPSCKQAEPKSTGQEVVTPNKDIPLKNTVNADSAASQIALYEKFANTLKGKVRGYAISNYNVDSFPMPIRYISFFGALMFGSDLKKQDTSRVIWAMLAIDTVNKAPHINMYFVCKDTTATLRYYDVTSNPQAKTPTLLDSLTARTRINTYQKYVNLLVQKIDISSFCLAAAQGFQVNYTDLVQLSAQPKATNATNLYAVLVLKPCETETNPKQQTIDMYMNIDLQLNGSAADGGGGGNTYFDFTLPCPTNCPW